MTVTIELPLPPKQCKPNQRAHWWYASQAVKQYREEAFYAARAANAQPMQPPVRLSAAFYMGRKIGDGRYRPTDIFNGIASLKAAIDGIVDASVIPDDNARCLQCGEVRFVGAKQAGVRACVVVTLSAVTIGETLDGGGGGGEDDDGGGRGA